MPGGTVLAVFHAQGRTDGAGSGGTVRAGAAPALTGWVMADFHEDTTRAIALLSFQGGAASFTPVRGEDGAAERSVVRTVVELLERAASDPDATPHVAVLAQVLLPWLAEQHFLAVQVDARGFRACRVACGAAPALSAALAAAGVREVLFKQGMAREELDRFASALYRGRRGDLAAALWGADLGSIVVRFTDEFCFTAPPRLGAWTAVQCARWSSEQDDLVSAFDAGPGPASPGVDWRNLVAPATGDPARLARLRLDTPSEAATRWSRTLAEIGARHSEPVTRAAAADALGRLGEALLDCHKLTWLHDGIGPLQRTEPDATGQAPPWLEPLLDRFTTEANARALGMLFEDRAADAVEVVAARQVLAALPWAVEPLGALMEHVDSMQGRKTLSLVVAAAASRAPERLVAYAEKQPLFAAQNLAYILGRIGDASVVPHLARWARSEDERVRVEAARALGQIRAASAAAILCELLDDPESHVRQSAVWALSRSGDLTALSRLRTILFESKAFRDRRAEEREDFFRTYGRLADDAAFAEMVERLGQRKFISTGWNTELRRGAALGLGESGRPEALDVLRTHQNTRDAKLRQACASAIAVLEARLSSPHLADEDDWCEPAQIGAGPVDGSRFRLEARDV